MPKPREPKRYKMPKGFAPGKKRMRGEPIMYAETKQKLNLSLTPTDIDSIKNAAATEGISASELVGKWAREIHQLEEEVRQLRSENEVLRSQPVKDYEAVRDRILKNWRVAKAPEKKQRFKEVLDRFIEELLTPDS